MDTLEINCSAEQSSWELFLKPEGSLPDSKLATVHYSEPDVSSLQPPILFF
jgi:hypothetical protein